jgi:hypothetical protein
MTRRDTTAVLDRFIASSQEKFPNAFDFTKTVIDEKEKKVIITCKKCGNDVCIARQNHLRSKFGGCMKCHPPKQAKGIDQFIKEAKIIHGDKYDYSEAEYVHKDTPIIIKCNDCKVTAEQTPGNHLSGRIPCECKETTLSNEEFVKRANSLHNNLYEYTPYVSMRKKITITCKKCGHSKQVIPKSHLSTKPKGCSECGSK